MDKLNLSQWNLTVIVKERSLIDFASVKKDVLGFVSFGRKYFSGIQLFFTCAKEIYGYTTANERDRNVLFLFPAGRERVRRMNFILCVGADAEVMRLSRNQRGEIYRAISQDNSRPAQSADEGGDGTKKGTGRRREREILLIIFLAKRPLLVTPLSRYSQVERIDWRFA